jgi:molecular chaperone DnaK
VLLLDVIPIAIGLRAKDGVMAIVVPRNSAIPGKFSQTFSTATNGQKDVEILVYQGERDLVKDNMYLGKFTLEGIPTAPKGIPQIEVTFELDADGVLQVEARDKLTGKAQKLKIEAYGGLSDEQVAKMLKDAEDNAAADALARAKREAGFMAEKQLKDAAADAEEWTRVYPSQTAPVDLKEAFTLTVKELTEAVAKKDVDVMLEKTARLEEIRLSIGQAFYEAAAQNNAETPNPEETPKNDNTPEGPTP